MEIRYIPFEDIDKVKWNSCIHFAVNSEVSGYHWWLKAVVKEWDAIVEGDYESVMPLFYQKDLWGRKVLYQPKLLGKIGIQSIHMLSRKRIIEMLNLLPETPSIQIQLNEMNILPPDLDIKSEQHTAHRLLLSKPLSVLRAAYSPEVRELIRKELPPGYFFQVMMKPEEIVEFCQKNKQLPYDQYESLRVFYNLLHRGTLVSNVLLDENKNPIALLVITYHMKKIKVLVTSQNKKGSDLKAIYRLYDHVFNLHQNKAMMFEFFHSDGEVAEGLGADEYVYWEIKQSDRLGNWSKRLKEMAIFN